MGPGGRGPRGAGLPVSFVVSKSSSCCHGDARSVSGENLDGVAVDGVFSGAVLNEDGPFLRLQGLWHPEDMWLFGVSRNLFLPYVS